MEMLAMLKGCAVSVVRTLVTTPQGITGTKISFENKKNDIL